MSKPLIDPGFRDIEFTQRLLQSADFSNTTLVSLSQGNHRLKEMRAREVAEGLHDGRIDPITVLQSSLAQPSQWLSFRLGRGAPALPLDIRPAAQLLFEFGSDGWYGPIPHASEGTQWLVRIFSVPTHIKTGDHQVPANLRWIIKAELAETFVALHWDGFTIFVDPRRTYSTQYPFWTIIPGLFEELEDLLGLAWTTPNLHALVLQTLWDRYLYDPEYVWRHLRIRAEARGVTLNASSSGVAEIDVAGLEALTRALAESAANGLGMNLTPEQESSVESSLLRTMIHEWGTNSYEFELARNARILFRGHCYFGLRENLGSQDSVQHIKTYKRTGGSFASLRFLLDHL